MCLATSCCGILNVRQAPVWLHVNEDPRLQALRYESTAQVCTVMGVQAAVWLLPFKAQAGSAHRIPLLRKEGGRGGTQPE